MGMIGTGTYGRAGREMVRKLIKNGHECVVYAGHETVRDRLGKEFVSGLTPCGTSLIENEMSNRKALRGS